jgi:hypothetical protein
MCAFHSPQSALAYYADALGNDPLQFTFRSLIMCNNPDFCSSGYGVSVHLYTKHTTLPNANTSGDMISGCLINVVVSRSGAVA